MKQKLCTTLLLSTLFFTALFAQTVDEGYEVATWKNFKNAAVSYTFDDNFSNQLSIMVPMFNEFDYKLTLFTFTNSFNAANYEGLAEAAAQGHEVGSHTVTHQNLSDLSDAEQTSELANSKKTIEENIPGYKVQTIAYPYCVSGNDDLTKQYYVAARGCSGQVASKSPNNAMNITSMVIGSEGHATTSALNGRVDAAANSGGWAVFLGHAIDGENGYSEVSSEEIRGNLEYMSENDSKFWVSSFGNVFKYFQSRNNASVTEISSGETAIEVELTDDLTDSVYNQALTIRRVLPNGWDSVTVMQDTVKLKVQIVEIGDEKFAQFNAMPDAGTITLEKMTATTNAPEPTGQADSFEVFQNYPNPFNPTTNIMYRVSQPGKVKIEVYNMLGKHIETLVNETKNPGRYSIQWDAENEVSGTYFYRFQTETFMKTGKMMLIK